MSRTIQQTQNNSASTQITEVGTNTGFNAGDLVYYQNGDYKGAPNLTLPSTANFAATAALPVTPQNLSYSFNQAGNGVGVFGGSQQKCAAVLTNGNIVQVFISMTNSQPYFQIVNTSNVVQVAATVISATYLNTAYTGIGVLALTGGGFVAYWVNNTGGTTNTMNYAVYTNTGSVTTAATQDTSFSFGAPYVTINGVGLANGGFVLCGGNNNTLAVQFRGYSSTGVGSFGVTNAGTNIVSNAYNSIGLAARSDSSFMLFFATSTTIYSYFLYTSAGSSITSNTITIGTNSGTQCDVSTMSDGTTYVLVYNGYSSGLYTGSYRFLPTGNTLGSEFSIPAVNFNKGQASGTIYPPTVLGLSNGNFIATFYDAGSPTPGLNYVVINSSGACVTGTNSNGTVPLPLTFIPGISYSLNCLIETSAAICVHWGTSAKSSSKTANTYYVQLSKTTYLPIPAVSVAATVGTASGAASGLGYANSVPTAVSVAATTTGAVTVPTSPAYVVSPSTLYSTNPISSNASATFPDGRFVLAYRDGTTYAVYASVFSSSGALQTTINVGTGYASGSTGMLAVCCLSSGKFVVSYATSNTTTTHAMYSSTYSFLSATTTAAASNDTNHNMSSAGLSNDRWVFTYFTSSNYSAYDVYDANNTLIAGPAIFTAGNCYNIGVAATNWGSFMVTYYYPGASANYTQHVYNSTGNTYVTFANTSMGASNGLTNNRATTWSGGMMMYLYNSSGVPYPYWANDSITDYATGSAMTGYYDITTYPNIAMGCTGFGNPVAFMPSASPTTPAYSIYAWENKIPGWTNAFTFPNSGNFSSANSLSFRGNAGYGTQPTVTSGVGNSVVVSWANSSGYLQYAIINIVPVSSTLVLTAGVTSSAPIPVSPATTTISSTVVAGTFVGVAASTASAGGTGQVISNGPAKLNATYTNAASGAFDHSGTPTGGVRGTYNGKIVNMQGNT